MPHSRDRYFSFRLHEHLENEPSEHIQPKKLLVIAGINGDFQAFCNLLIKSEVLDTSLGWIFQDNHLVILGDYVARNAEPVEALWFIYSLENMAKKAGGYVHFILGDHELACLNGDWCYAHPRYVKSKGRSSYETAALFDGNGELKRWLLTKNVVEKIGNNLFMHGALTHRILEEELSLQDINDLARRRYTTNGQVEIRSFINMKLDREKMHATFEESLNGLPGELLTDRMLTHFNVRTIVSGLLKIRHVSGRCNDKVVDICTIHEERSEALFVKYDRFYKFDLEGRLVRIKQTGIWNGKHVVRQE